MSVQICCHLGQTEMERNTFFFEDARVVGDAVSDYLQGHLVVIRDEKRLSFFTKFEITTSSFLFTRAIYK